MSKYSINDGTLVSIAKAIRAQEKSTGAISVADFASRVSALVLPLVSPTDDITGENTMKYIIDETTITEIADAIRGQEGSTDNIPVEEFASRILALKDGDFTPASWTDGSYEDIAKTLEYHYAGYLDVADYWNVGDTRIIPLGNMSKGSIFQEDMAGLSIAFRIIGFNTDVGSFIVSTEGKGVRSKAAILVEATTVLPSKAIIGANNTSYDGVRWTKSELYNWLNADFAAALPTEIQSLVKLISPPSNNYYNPSLKYIQTDSANCKYFLLSNYELSGLKGCEYYANTESYGASPERVKTDQNGVPCDYWTRTNGASNNYMHNDRYCYVLADGSIPYSQFRDEYKVGYSEYLGVAPAFCL